MRVIKVIACVMALLIVLGSVSFAAKTKTTVSQTQSTTVNNQKLMLKKISKLMSKRGLDESNFSFGYYDIYRDFECYCNRDKLFEPYEAIKFPLGYLYFNEYQGGKYSVASEIGNKKFMEIFVESLTEDNTNATNILINNYGGMRRVKAQLKALTKTKVPNEFYNTELLNAAYCIDFLKLYYRTAKYSSSDFRTMMVDSLKEFTPGEYSERYITKYRVTHRYGRSAQGDCAVDMGLVKSEFPFLFVVSVQGVENAEEVLAEVMRYICEFNEDYSALLISQITTKPDVPESERKTYTTRSYTKPILAGLVIFGVTVSAVVAIIIIRRDRRLRKIYEDDDDEVLR